MSPHLRLASRLTPSLTRTIPKTLPSSALTRSTTARHSSQYHYPEGPLSSIPFNPRTKYFGVRYWGTCGFFFMVPFGIAVWQTFKNKA